jgi:hypothetical protein
LCFSIKVYVFTCVIDVTTYTSILKHNGLASIKFIASQARTVNCVIDVNTYTSTISCVTIGLIDTKGIEKGGKWTTWKI